MDNIRESYDNKFKCRVESLLTKSIVQLHIRHSMRNSEGYTQGLKKKKKKTQNFFIKCW